MGPVDISQSLPASRASKASHVSRGLLSQVSIVIPVGPEDVAWQSLVSDLADVDMDAELLLISARREPSDFDQLHAAGGAFRGIRWIATTAGRAHQMNTGAQLSTRPFFWFLHADSRVSIDAFEALERSLATHPHALHFFDLVFQDDGPSLVRLNALGVRVRSRYLGLPFGDQGLCTSRDTFQRLGGFDEQVEYGEDHLFVWAAHRHRVPLHRVGAFITTSARKYRAKGWLATTVLHGWRTWRQAIPEFCRLLRNRIK